MSRWSLVLVFAQQGSTSCQLIEPSWLLVELCGDPAWFVVQVPQECDLGGGWLLALVQGKCVLQPGGAVRCQPGMQGMCVLQTVGAVRRPLGIGSCLAGLSIHSLVHNSSTTTIIIYRTIN